MSILVQDDMQRRVPHSQFTSHELAAPASPSDTYAHSAAETEHADCPRAASAIDFSNVHVYVPALQATAALTASCITCLATSWLGTIIGVSAVRTAMLSGVVGVVVLWRPMRLFYARGADIMFDALRPVMLVYMVALIAEQLVHSCGPLHTGALSMRHWLFYACTMIMTAGGFAQAWQPKAPTDYPFAVSVGALLIVAVFAPPPRMGEGPLCDMPSTRNAIERLVRTILFSATYCSLAYASEPARHSVKEVILCSMRAAAGSVWTLAVHPYIMWLAVLQSLIVLWSRIQPSATRDLQCTELEPLSDAKSKDSDIEEGDPDRDIAYTGNGMHEHQGAFLFQAEQASMDVQDASWQLQSNGGHHFQSSLMHLDDQLAPNGLNEPPPQLTVSLGARPVSTLKVQASARPNPTAHANVMARVAAQIVDGQA